MVKADRVEAVVAIIRRSDSFLVVKRSDKVDSARGYWSPISGRIEEGETQEEALKREVMEEVGLEVTAVEHVRALPSPDGRYLLHYWTTEILGGEARLMGHEATAMKWATLEEMKHLQPVFEEDIRIIEELIAQVGRGRHDTPPNRS
jgi:8-oxo-dGTP diphosphatase